jgi:hypothetical protein
MDIKISIKIKLEKGKEIILDGDDAKQLYFKLKELYETKNNYIPYPVYQNAPWITWSSHPGDTYEWKYSPYTITCSID